MKQQQALNNTCCVQILRWLQQPPPEEPVQKQMRTDASSSIRAASSRTQLVLTLQTEDEERIALLVLSAMYAVQPLPDLLAALSQKQLLQATVLADMWQVPDLGVAAVEKLLTAPDLSEETVRLFLQLPAELPAVLRPLVGKVVEAAREQHVGSPADAKRLLLNVFGDLEAVLASSTLSELLWKLSVSAMKLLLSCDALKVSFGGCVLQMHTYAETEPGAFFRLPTQPLHPYTATCPSVALLQ